MEDETSVRNLLRRFLDREGFRVLEASSVSQALEALDGGVEVVVTDIGLPDGHGGEVVSAVRSRYPGTPVVVMSGLDDARITDRALGSGADRFLFKPFNLPDLRSQLRQALGRTEGPPDGAGPGADLEPPAHRPGNGSGPRLVRAPHLAAPHLAARPPAASGDARRPADVGRRRNTSPPDAVAREALVKGLRCLAAAAEGRDLEGPGHGRRTADYAAVLHRAVGEAAADVPLESLRLGCELHDLGRLGRGAASPVPFPSPRGSDGAPADPVVGRRILEPLIDDPVVLAVVAHHQERWDGSGRPSGLAREAIPLAARIAALADDLDERLSAHRESGDDGWRRAVDGVREGAHDPRLVRALEDSLPALRAVRAVHVGDRPRG